MRMHQYAALARELRDTFEQRACATDGEARREAITNPAVRTSVPLFEQCERCIDRSFCLFVQCHRHVLARIHHALADGRAKARFLDRVKDFACVIHGLHRQRAGRAAFDQLRDAEPCRSANGFRRVGSLQRPDALLQPINQWQIVGRAAKERLAEMYVRLYEAGQDGAAARVNRLIG